MLPTLGTTPSKPLMDDLAATMASLNDNNLVATVHCYGFWSFSTNIAGCTTFGKTSKKPRCRYRTRSAEACLSGKADRPRRTLTASRRYGSGG